MATIMYKQRLGPKVLVHRFALGSKIGEGSFCKVKEGVDAVGRVRVAVKIVKGATLRKADRGLLSLQREVDILTSCDHPGIVKFVEYFVIAAKDKHYIVTELLAGATVSKLAPQLPPLPRLVSTIGRQCAEALQYLHARGIVHRDLKPDNVMVCRNGSGALDLRTVIIDFGVAVRSAEEAEQFSNPGSPAFQPPELASGDNIFPGPPMDVWGWGVILYMALTGNVFPFTAPSPFAMFERIAACDYDEMVLGPEAAPGTTLCPLGVDLVRQVLVPLPRPSLDTLLAHDFLARPNELLQDKPDTSLNIPTPATALPDSYVATITYPLSNPDSDLDDGSESSSSSHSFSQVAAPAVQVTPTMSPTRKAAPTTGAVAPTAASAAPASRSSGSRIRAPGANKCVTF